MNSSIQVQNLDLAQSKKQIEILDECDHFAETVKKITADFRHGGGTSRTLPNFPKAALLAMMNQQPKPKAVLTGDGLDCYLRSKIINTGKTDVVMIPTPENEPPTCLDDLINKLITGYRILQSTYAKVFGCSLIYGEWLQQAFKYVNNPNNLSGYRGKWEKWLSDKNIGIKVSHARMLRTLAKKFYRYKGFHSLSIPLTEFWKKRNEIEDMLQNVDKANFWKEYR